MTTHAAPVYCDDDSRVLRSTAVKTLTVRLPGPLVAEIEREARARRLSKSDVVRERLQHAGTRARDPLAGLEDIIGAVDGLPPDLASDTRRHLRAHGYGKPRRR